jgi:hypothetical protein
MHYTSFIYEAFLQQSLIVSIKGNWASMIKRKIIPYKLEKESKQKSKGKDINIMPRYDFWNSLMQIARERKRKNAAI